MVPRGGRDFPDLPLAHPRVSQRPPLQRTHTRAGGGASEVVPWGRQDCPGLPQAHPRVTQLPPRRQGAAEAEAVYRGRQDCPGLPEPVLACRFGPHIHTQPPPLTKPAPHISESRCPRHVTLPSSELGEPRGKPQRTRKKPKQTTFDYHSQSGSPFGSVAPNGSGAPLPGMPHEKHET